MIPQFSTDALGKLRNYGDGSYSLAPLTLQITPADTARMRVSNFRKGVTLAYDGIFLDSTWGLSGILTNTACRSPQRAVVLGPSAGTHRFGLNASIPTFELYCDPRYCPLDSLRSRPLWWPFKSNVGEILPHYDRWLAYMGKIYNTREV